MGADRVAAPDGAGEPVRIVIADESPIVTAALRAAMHAGGMLVAATCENAEETFREVLATRPDALLLSSGLPGGALETVAWVRGALPDVEVIVLADDADAAAMMAMVTAGAHGILLGAADPVRLPNAVAGVLRGETAFPRRLVRVMADALASEGRHRGLDGGPALTAREFQVLELLAAGTAVDAAAARLGIEASTVHRHAANAANKLGASDRAHAMRLFATRVGQQSAPPQ